MISIVFNLVLVLAGFWLLIRGASWLVDGASIIARRWGASDLLVGLTIVSMGTSAPELLINLASAWNNTTDLALANVIGSCIANVLLILGASAIVAPLAVAPSTVFKEIPFCLLASVIVTVMANDTLLDGSAANALTRSDGLILLGFFSVFLYYLASLRKAPPGENNPPLHIATSSHRPPLLYLIIGLVTLVCGGELTVRGATQLALLFGASERLIGLTILAVGTSLPELVTSLVATMKGKVDISIGNVIGSNIFNLFWILGISASITPLAVSDALNLDIVTMTLTVGFLLILIQPGRLKDRLRFWRIQQGHVLTRTEGVVLLTLYVLYIVTAVLA